MDNQRNITAYLKLKELTERLSHMGFVRIHKSFIISLSHLTTVEGNTVKVLNETKSIAIGEAYRKEFFELVNARLLSLPPDMSAGKQYQG